MDIVSLEGFLHQILPDKYYNKRHYSGFQSCSLLALPSAAFHLLGGGWRGSAIPQKGIIMLWSFFTWFFESMVYTDTLEQSCMKYSQNSRTKWSANR